MSSASLRAVVVAVVLLVAALGQVEVVPGHAYPSSFSCDNPDTWVGGGTFGNMQIASFSAGGSHCVLTFSAESSELVLTSDVSLGHKVHASAGKLEAHAGFSSSQDAPACRSAYKQKVSRYTWAPDAAQQPGDVQITFHGLCGAFSLQAVYAATPLATSVTVNATSGDPGEAGGASMAPTRAPTSSAHSPTPSFSRAVPRLPTRLWTAVLVTTAMLLVALFPAR